MQITKTPMTIKDFEGVEYVRVVGNEHNTHSIKIGSVGQILSVGKKLVEVRFEQDCYIKEANYYHQNIDPVSLEPYYPEHKSPVVVSVTDTEQNGISGGEMKLNTFDIIASTFDMPKEHLIMWAGDAPELGIMGLIKLRRALNEAIDWKEAELVLEIAKEKDRRTNGHL